MGKNIDLKIYLKLDKIFFSRLKWSDKRKNSGLKKLD